MIELRPQFASASDLVGWLNLWPTRLSPKSSKRKRTLRDWSQKLFRLPDQNRPLFDRAL